MTSPIEDITEEVRDPKFAKEYGQELAKMNVAITLAKARAETGLTQGQLAQKAGTSQPYIAKLESGNANPSIGAVGEILAVLGFRLVPDKDSLVPGIKSSGQLNYGLLPEALFMSPGMILIMRTASGLTPNPDITLWQNPNLLPSRLPSSLDLRTLSESVSLVSAGKGVTANNEKPELTGN